MKKFAVIGDSTCDLGKDIREKLDIDYLKMNITCNGKEYEASLDWDSYSPKELYDWMRNGFRVMTTQVPAKTFEDKFEEYLKEDIDILYIGCSSALSGSVNTSIIVRDELLLKYPDAKIYCIDSLNSCLGQGIMLIKAAELREAGLSIDEVAKNIEEMKLKVNQFATVESLEYLKRAGRIKASKAFFGNIFGVKPIIISDKIGQNYASMKVKGRKNSIIQLVEMAKSVIENSEDQIIYLGHADAESDCEIMKELVLQNIKCKGVYVNYIGPIIGASTGPGTMAIYCIGKEVTIIGD